MLVLPAPVTSALSSLAAIPQQDDGPAYDPPPEPPSLQDYARQQAERYGLDPHVFDAQINQESGYQNVTNPNSGAQGPGQLMPDTARGLGVDPSDPYQNLEGAARYHRQLLDYYDGDQASALAAYNAGPGNIDTLKKRYGADWRNHLTGVSNDVGLDLTETNTYLDNILGGGGAQQGGYGPWNALGHPSPYQQQPTQGQTPADPALANIAAGEAGAQEQYGQGAPQLDQGVVAQTLLGSLRKRNQKLIDDTLGSGSGLSGAFHDMFHAEKVSRIADIPGADTVKKLVNAPTRIGLDAVLPPLGVYDATRAGLKAAGGPSLPDLSGALTDIVNPVPTNVRDALIVGLPLALKAWAGVGRVTKGVEETRAAANAFKGVYPEDWGPEQIAQYERVKASVVGNAPEAGATAAPVQPARLQRIMRRGAEVPGGASDAAIPTVFERDSNAFPTETESGVAPTPATTMPAGTPAGGTSTNAPTPVTTTTGAEPEPGTFTTGTSIDKLIGIERPNPKLTRVDEATNALKGVLPWAGVKEQANATTTMRERTRTKQVVDSQANRVASVVGDAQRVFETDKNGKIVTLPGEPTIQDVAARLPEYADLLTPEQHQGLERVKAELEPWTQAWKESGLPDVGSRADVVDGGFYIPRGSPTAEGISDNPTAPKAGRRSAGGRQGFEKSATYESMAEGIANGERYPMLPDSVRDYVKGAGGRIIDNATANAFKDSGLGQTEAQRMEEIAPGLTAKVGKLRAQIHGKLETLVRQDVRGSTSERATDRLERLLNDTEERVTKAMDKADTKVSGTPGMMRAEAELRTLEREADRVAGVTQASAEHDTTLAARNAQTHKELAALRDELDGITGEYKAAQAKAGQTPRGQGRIAMNALQGMTFPEEVANAANKYIEAEGKASGRGAGVIRAIDAVNNLLRGVRATGDVSFMGIQGLLGAAHSPDSYLKAMIIAAKSVGNPEAFGKFIQEFDAATAERGAPSSSDWAREGVHIGGRDTEYAVGRGITEKLKNAPVIAQSDRAFGVFGDTLRLLLADAFYQPGQTDTKAMAKAANLMTGWTTRTFGGDLGGLANFAPRFFQSQLDLLAHATTDGGRTGSEARKSLLKLIGLGTLITVGANQALGNDGFDYLQPMKNGKLNSNFMRIRAVGQDISLFGPWDSLLRGIVATATGDPGYMLRTKASPIVQLAWDAITEKTFTGKTANGLNPAHWSTEGTENFLRGLVPFSITDIGRQPIAQTLLGATGLKSSPLTPSEERDQAAYDATGKHYNDLSPLQKRDFDNSDAGKSAKGNMPETDYQKRKAEVTAPLDARQQQAEDAWKKGELSQPLPDIWHDISIARHQAALDLSTQFAEQFKGFNKSQYDTALEGLYKIQVTTSDGSPDFTATDAKRAEYMKTLTPDQQQWIKEAQQVSQEKQSPVYQQYRAYIDKRKELGYYADGITTQQKQALDKANPMIDVQNWIFQNGIKVEYQDKFKPPTLNSEQAVKSALALGLPAETFPVKLAGLPRPINQTPGSLQAWQDTGPLVQRYLDAARNPVFLDAAARNLYGGVGEHPANVKFADLTDSQKSSAVSSVHAEILADPKIGSLVDGALAYWGTTKTLNSDDALAVYNAMLKRYGNKAPTANAKPPTLASNAR